jgi:hypothetical protein
MDGIRGSRSLREVYGYEPGWGELSPRLQQELSDILGTADAVS